MIGKIEGTEEDGYETGSDIYVPDAPEEEEEQAHNFSDNGDHKTEKSGQSEHDVNIPNPFRRPPKGPAQDIGAKKLIVGTGSMKIDSAVEDSALDAIDLGDDDEKPLNQDGIIGIKDKGHTNDDSFF